MVQMNTIKRTNLTAVESTEGIWIYRRRLYENCTKIKENMTHIQVKEIKIDSQKMYFEKITNIC